MVDVPVSHCACTMHSEGMALVPPAGSPWWVLTTLMLWEALRDTTQYGYGWKVPHPPRKPSCPQEASSDALGTAAGRQVGAPGLLPLLVPLSTGRSPNQTFTALPPPPGPPFASHNKGTGPSSSQAASIIFIYILSGSV